MTSSVCSPAIFFLRISEHRLEPTSMINKRMTNIRLFTVVAGGKRRNKGDVGNENWKMEWGGGVTVDVKEMVDELIVRSHHSEFVKESKSTDFKHGSFEISWEWRIEDLSRKLHLHNETGILFWRAKKWVFILLFSDLVFIHSGFWIFCVKFTPCAL